MEIYFWTELTTHKWGRTATQSSRRAAYSRHAKTQKHHKYFSQILAADIFLWHLALDDADTYFKNYIRLLNTVYHTIATCGLFTSPAETTGQVRW